VTTELLVPASAVADLRMIPLSEMPALGLDDLGRMIERVLPYDTSLRVRERTFQSSI
jgi:hypothetical protein